MVLICGYRAVSDQPKSFVTKYIVNIKYLFSLVEKILLMNIK